MRLLSDPTERAICAVICRSDGLKAKEIAAKLGIDRKTVNQTLYASPLMQELCYQDKDSRWHGIVRQTRPHSGLMEFSGYYSSVRAFLQLTEEQFLVKLTQGCTNIGRSLSDTRGLYHSFRDAREQMLRLFHDLQDMLGERCLDWEIVFELRLKRSRHVRIYADVLVVTEDRVFALEFKMKSAPEPEEIRQAAKYTPYLEILFGPEYEVIPVLVMTKAADLFDFARIGNRDLLLPVCSGDMLFNVFDEYLGFLNREPERRS